jgi:hypothetical protein
MRVPGDMPCVSVLREVLFFRFLDDLLLFAIVRRYTVKVVNPFGRKNQEKICFFLLGSCAPENKRAAPGIGAALSGRINFRLLNRHPQYFHPL